ncbi:MAG: putative selenate ABC transporter substrate-binding protein [Actinomycetota bacterium]
MTVRPRSAGRRALIPTLLSVTLIAAACGSDGESSDAESGSDSSGGSGGGTLTIGAIPDQDPEILQRTYDLLGDFLEEELDVEVEYVPVTEYQAAVTGFAVGDLDLAWFGAVTGVQARLEVEGAEAIAQRDIDEQFTSVFIARTDSGIEPVDDVSGLSVVAGRSLTFGSESSTSGRLMPQSFLGDAGVSLDDLAGEPGFSGSHDATIEVVSAGSFEVGALSSEVWDARVESGDVDTDEVIEIFRTPQYVNYHWVAQPDLDERLGQGFTDDVVEALMSLDANDPDDAAILDLFTAGGFIPTESENYDAIESVARDIDLIRS